MTVINAKKEAYSVGEKKWYIYQLQKLGITKHPKNLDSLKKYKTSELATIFHKATSEEE